MLAGEVADLVVLGVDLGLAGFGEGEVGRLTDLATGGLAGRRSECSFRSSA